MFDIVNKQISIPLRLSVSDLGVSAAVCLILSTFTWIVLRPTVGFDDANITLNYAQNIANGLGYVYYEGGERVEGSTSALWTAVAVLGYLITDSPEGLFAAMGFAFTTGMILYTILICAQPAADGGHRGGLCRPDGGRLLCAGAGTFRLDGVEPDGDGAVLFPDGRADLGGGPDHRRAQSLTGTHPNRLGAALAVFAVLMVLTRPEGDRPGRRHPAWCCWSSAGARCPGCPTRF